MIFPVTAALGILMGAALVFVLVRPSAIFVERSIVVQAQPAVVFGVVEDLRNWPGWSADDIATMARSYGAMSRGVGAVCDWSGRKSAGRLTIIGSTIDREIVVAFRFDRPFRSHIINTFSIESFGPNAARVTWAMRGSKVFPLKPMGLVASPKRILGRQFERGLTRLKLLAEQPAQNLQSLISSSRQSSTWESSRAPDGSET